MGESSAEKPWWERYSEEGKELAAPYTDLWEGQKRALRDSATILGDKIDGDDSGPQIGSRADYQAQDPYRRQVQADIGELGRLAQQGGPATQGVRDLQRDQAAAQIALSRGGGGGAAMRRGTEAAGESFVQSIAATELAIEAEKQGYTRQESAAAGMLAMNDNEFAHKLEQWAGDIKRGTVMSRQQEAAQAGQAVASLIGAGASAVGGGEAGAKDGGVVPGEGNEDTVAAKLTPGEIVIPKELSAQLMEVISRSIGENRGTIKANTGGTVRRDPSTGYLTQEPDAGDYMRRMAQVSPGQQVMGQFGGDMTELSEWYEGRKKKPRDWGEALKMLSAGGKR